MLKNYLKSALRAVTRRKGHSAINIAGLTLGLACCLIIFQYVAFEYSFDRFHENERDIYRVLQAAAREGEKLEFGGSFTAQAFAPTMEEAVPEILHISRVHPEYNGALVANPDHPERTFEEEQAYYVDPDFLKMFSFPLVAGSSNRSPEPGTLLISESTARKYFGSENPIGHTLDWAGMTETSYRVSGVFKDVPAQSHLQFDFLLPIHDLLLTENYSTEPEGGWSWNNFSTYIQLQPSADPNIVDQKMTEVFAAHRGAGMRESGFVQFGVHAQPLRDIHLNADVLEPLNAVMGSYRTVYFFTVIGLVTLLIALVNYVNLATARALDRAREVGVRKASGARRRQLIGQFLFESGLTIVVAAVFAVILAALAIPLVNRIAETQLSGMLWTTPIFWVAACATFVAATVLAGMYPAFVLSSFKPADVLKGKGVSLKGQFRLRKALVVFQFAASIVLIGGTAVVYNQLTYMRQMDLGLDLEQVLTVRAPRVLPDGTDWSAAIGTFTQELRRLHGVRQVATSGALPGQGFNWNGAMFHRASEDPASSRRGVIAYIDTSFADLYGLELLAGLDFKGITVSDDEDAPWQMMVNETTTRALGFSNPADAVGEPLNVAGYDARIVGVYADFNWMSAHEARQNIFFGPAEAERHVSIRVSTDNVSATMAEVERIYHGHFPGNVFTYTFLDEAFDRQYRNDVRFASLFTFFAGLAIIIACLGLFGLASFTAQQRTKEIGVRKVLGASVGGLVRMLAQDFVKLVLVAVLIASPIAYLLMQQWLEGFAYRVEMGPGVFVLVGALALVVALLTVSFQSIRAARTDPAQSLRSE